MEINTESANAVIRASHNQSEETMLDASCKQVLAIKGVLAWLLKACVPEFKDADVKDIENRYIEGEPLVALVGVAPDEAGADLKKYLDSDETHVIVPTTKGEIISGLNTELTLPEEGKVTFDIFFRAITPQTGELIRLYIDVEAQNNTNPGYPLTKRAIYNVCRIISAQKGVEFADDEYEDIKKAYTIWVCPKPPEKKKGTITRYFIQEECLVGETKEEKRNYDLLEARMVYLPGAGGKEGKGILRMLDKLLSPSTTLEEKLDSLKNDFDVAITKSVERKVQKMCDYSTVVKNEAKEEQARETAETLQKMHMEPVDIAKAVHYPLDIVEKWLGLVKA